MRYRFGRARPRIFLPIFFSVLPGIFLIIYAAVGSRRWVTALVGVFLLLAAWIGAYLVNFRRAAQLVRLTRRLSAGDYHARAGLQRRFGLFTDLAQAFDTMAASLERQTSQLKALHRQTEQQLQRLGALRTIDIAITSSLDLGITMDVLLDQVTTQLGIDAACLLVSSGYDHTLEFSGSRGFQTDALHYTRLSYGEGYAGRAALEQQTIYVPDLRAPQINFLRSPSLAAEGFVTYYAVPLIAKGQVKGVLEVFHRAPIELENERLDFLEALSGQAAIAIDNASLFTELQRSNTELSLAYDSTLEGWSRALDLRDQDTAGHTQRVSEFTLRLAKAMTVDEQDLIHIRRGALLHDIGKLAVPDRILLKPGPRTEEQRQIMRMHPVYAYEMLSPIAFLRQALDIPYCHHEKWDGTGYPRGLKGEQIPITARVFTVVDVWDALRSERPYRRSWPDEQVHAYLREQAGRHFDPKVVDVFLTMV